MAAAVGGGGGGGGGGFELCALDGELFLPGMKLVLLCAGREWPSLEQT